MPTGVVGGDSNVLFVINMSCCPTLEKLNMNKSIIRMVRIHCCLSAQHNFEQTWYLLLAQTSVCLSMQFEQFNALGKRVMATVLSTGHSDTWSKLMGEAQ